LPIQSQNFPSRLAAKLRTLPSDRGGYLDPGSGSYILQVAMAGLLGAAFAIKSSWLTIKTTIREKFGKRE
jgi:hypothetical protein